MLKLDKFCRNHHPFGVKMLTKSKSRGIRVESFKGGFKGVDFIIAAEYFPANR